MSYASEALKPRSQKVVLATIEARELAKLFILDSGSQYYRDVNHYVTAVIENGTPLTAGTLPLAAGRFYFNPITKRLYIRTSGSVNPGTRKITINYKFFFSTSGHTLPIDLASGIRVNWDGRLTGNGAIRQTLDDENVGVVVESSSSVTLINDDGFFDSIFDTLVWENREVSIWSWIASTPITEAQKLFSGIVTEKEFTSSTVNFRLRDFTFRLRDKLSLGIYSGAEGRMDEAQMGKPKRRLIGRLKQADCVGVDKILDGYPIIPTATGATDGTTVTFSQSILGDIFGGDEFTVTLRDGSDLKLTADSISSDGLTITISNDLETSFSDAAVTVAADEGHRGANRNWFLAGHEIHEPTYNIEAVLDTRRFQLDSVAGLYAGDIVRLNGVQTVIKRVSGDIVTTVQEVTPAPAVNDDFVRVAVSSVYIDGERLVPTRDFDLFNSGDAVIQLNSLAEFNITQPRSLNGTTLTFTSGSRVVASSSIELDLRTVLRARQWVRRDDPATPTYYEIAQVNQYDLLLVSPYIGATASDAGIYKPVKLITDDSVVTVDCYGLRNAAGDWVKTAADAVEYILDVDAGLTNIDVASFAKANASCDYILSMLLPDSTSGDTPEIRGTLSRINESVYGSLYTDADFQLAYSILNSSRPATLTALKDDDILSFSVTSKNQICDAVRLYYRPFTDAITGEATTEQMTEFSDFVDQTSGIEKLEEFTSYLYETDKAKIVAQRFLLFRSLPNSRVKVQSKLNLSTMSLNDKIYLELDRLYTRFGGRDRRKVGIIASIQKDGANVELEFNDLGGAFNRVGCIAPNTQSVYSSATRDDVARCAFIVDNTVETPNAASEIDLGLNLIG